jgi:hypothetical protein
MAYGRKQVQWLHPEKIIPYKGLAPLPRDDVLKLQQADQPGFELKRPEKWFCLYYVIASDYPSSFHGCLFWWNFLEGLRGFATILFKLNSEQGLWFCWLALVFRNIQFRFNSSKMSTSIKGYWECWKDYKKSMSAGRTPISNVSLFFFYKIFLCFSFHRWPTLCRLNKKT